MYMQKKRKMWTNVIYNFFAFFCIHILDFSPLYIINTMFLHFLFFFTYFLKVFGQDFSWDVHRTEYTTVRTTHKTGTVTLHGYTCTLTDVSCNTCGETCSALEMHTQLVINCGFGERGRCCASALVRNRKHDDGLPMQFTMHVFAYVHTVCKCIEHDAITAAQMCPTRLETRTKEFSVCASSQSRSSSA